MTEIFIVSVPAHYSVYSVKPGMLSPNLLSAFSPLPKRELVSCGHSAAILIIEHSSSTFRNTPDTLPVIFSPLRTFNWEKNQLHPTRRAKVIIKERDSGLDEQAFQNVVRMFAIQHRAFKQWEKTSLDLGKLFVCVCVL